MRLTSFAVKVPGRAWEPVGKFELLQWINLCDSNGDDVYEGDFIKISSTLYKVTWNKTIAGFELVGLKNLAKRNIADVSFGEIAGKTSSRISVLLSKIISTPLIAYDIIASGGVQYGIPERRS